MTFNLESAKDQIQAKIDELEKRISKYEVEADKYNKIVVQRKEEMQHALSTTEVSQIGESIDYNTHKRDSLYDKINRLGERQDGLKIALDILNGITI